MNATRLILFISLCLLQLVYGNVIVDTDKVIEIPISYTSEVLGPFERYSIEKQSVLRDASNKRAEYLVLRRLILISFGGALLSRGVLGITWSSSVLGKHVEVENQLRILKHISLLNLSLIHLGLTNLMLVWFGDDRTVKCAVQLNGFGCFANWLMFFYHKTGHIFSTNRNKIELIIWPLLALICAMYCKQI